MAKTEPIDERARADEDRRTLERALKRSRKKRGKDAGERQIAERLQKVAGEPDLADPQRHHGS